jgi:hypothetical protein
MMYYDHTTGDMAFTRDTPTAERNHIAVMMTAHQYPLSPEAAGQLHRFLGPAPVASTTEQARRRVQQALALLGLGHLTVEAVVTVLDDGWKLLLRIEAKQPGR